MSYTPTEWKTGDVITAEKLNNMESGIAGGQELFIIHATGIATVPGTPTTPVLDKTHEEITNAIQNGKMPVMIADVEASKVTLQFAGYIGGAVGSYAFYSIMPSVNNRIACTSVGVGTNMIASEFYVLVIPTDSTSS